MTTLTEVEDGICISLIEVKQTMIVEHIIKCSRNQTTLDLFQ